MKKSILGLAIFAVASSAIAASSDTFTLGFERSTGEYGNAQETTINAIPLSAKVTRGKLTYTLSVPLISVEGPTGVVSGVNQPTGVLGSSTNNQQTASPRRGLFGAANPVQSSSLNNSPVTKERGIGDTVVGVTTALIQYPADQLYLDGSFKVKLPTASVDKGLGTGKADYSVQVDLYKVNKGTTYFSTIGYKFVGKDPQFNLQNTGFASMGLSTGVGAGQAVGFNFDIRQSIAAFREDSQELTVFYSTDRLSPGTRTQFYATKGFSNSSPDIAIGTSYTYGF